MKHYCLCAKWTNLRKKKNQRLNFKSTHEYFGFASVEGLYYNKHVWAKVEADGNVRLGFNDVVARGSVKIFSIKLSPLEQLWFKGWVMWNL